MEANMADEQFDWSGDEVVAHGYGSLAVYLNPHGDIVIRQQRDGMGEEDTFIVIAQQHAKVIIAAIRDLAKKKRK
jgi:hypothetical protein